jgi:DNA-binding HxlR family transcriptional regulator
MNSTKNHQTSDCQRSKCPISCVLEVVGDKWTLLVVRDLFLGKHTFKALQSSAEKIPTNILTDRLKRLEQHGILYRKLYQQHPKRYQYYLTSKGRDLEPVMVGLVVWSNKYFPETYRLSEIKKMLAET